VCWTLFVCGVISQSMTMLLPVAMLFIFAVCIFDVLIYILAWYNLLVAAVVCLLFCLQLRDPGQQLLCSLPFYISYTETFTFCFSWCLRGFSCWIPVAECCYGSVLWYLPIMLLWQLRNYFFMLHVLLTAHLRFFPAYCKKTTSVLLRQNFSRHQRSVILLFRQSSHGDDDE